MQVGLHDRAELIGELSSVGLPGSNIS